MPVVGIYGKFPGLYLPTIREMVPDSSLRVCSEWGKIGEILDEVEVLLAYRFPSRPLPKEEILRAKCLKWLQLSSAGIDSILPYDPSKLIVTNTSGIHADTISQYVIGTLVMMYWDFPRLQRQQRDRHWERYFVPSLSGKTIGIIGAGKVGTSIANRARDFGMRALGIRRSGKPVEGFECMYSPRGLPVVMSESNVVVICLPLTSETRCLIGRDEIRLMRTDAYLVNIARGAIVDQSALLDALKEGSIAGAILDAFEQEPLPPESGLWSLPNVLITPHISGEFEDWPVEVARLFCANLRRWINREPLANVVDPGAGY